MKNDDEGSKRYHPFSRIALDQEMMARFQLGNRRSRDLQELLAELFKLHNYIEGDSNHIDDEIKKGMRYEIDEIRALISMIPAGNENELHMKCAALSNAAPVVLSNELLPVIAAASIRSDIFRLKPERPFPEWLSKWITA